MSTARSVAVLGYHKIGDPPKGTWRTWNFVPTNTFAAHLTILRHRGWRVIDLDRFIEGLRDPSTLPPRSALITFDDGYRSLLDVAEPCLRKFHHPAVVFVPTDFVGGTNTFDAGAEPEEAICDWDALRELQSRGVTIQSHGVAHRKFSELDRAARTVELTESKALLEERLQNAVRAFAFPYGDAGHNGSTDGLLEKTGYDAAFVYPGGILDLPTDSPYRLCRLAVGPNTDLEKKLKARES